MNLSSIAGTLGAAFGGYADDEKERLRQQQIALANQTGEDERLTKLRMAGFLPAPLGGTQVPNAPNLPSLPGVSAMPSQGGQPGAGIVPRAMGPSLDRFLGGDTPGQAIAPQGGQAQGPAILDKLMQNTGNQGTTPPLTIRTSKGPQSFEFDYDSSPQGIMEKRQTSLQTLRDKDAADRAQANERQKAQDALTEKQRQQTEREKIIQNRILSLRATYPNAKPEQLRGTAENDAAFAAAVKPDTPNKDHWVSAGVNKDGEPVILNSMTGETKQGGGAKGTGAGAGERSGMAAAFLSRLKMGKADFDNGMNFIKDYHEKLANPASGVQITPEMMAEQAVAETNPNADAHGITGSLGNAATAFMQGHANSAVAKDHPDYQRYRNLINSMSLALTEVLPRPTQQLLGIEKGINISKAGDTPERIADIQHRLDKAYEYLFANPDAMLQRGGTPAAPQSQAKQAQRAALWNSLVQGGMDKETAKATALRQIP